MSKQTIILDFDGVIHSYKSGWKGATEIPDPPTPGAKEAIARLRDRGFEVVVVSSRCSQAGGVVAVMEWLDKHDIFVDGVRADKPPHVLVVDDRAFRFEGRWDDVLTFAQTGMEPWTKGGS